MDVMISPVSLFFITNRILWLWCTTWHLRQRLTCSLIVMRAIKPNHSKRPLHQTACCPRHYRIYLLFLLSIATTRIRSVLNNVDTTLWSHAHVSSSSFTSSRGTSQLTACPLDSRYVRVCSVFTNEQCDLSSRPSSSACSLDSLRSTSASADPVRITPLRTREGQMCVRYVSKHPKFNFQLQVLGRLK